MLSIPTISIQAKTLAEAWEKSMIALYENGIPIKTQYDKPGDPPSKDSSTIITIDEPLSEPMIHKDFPGGLEDLQEYVMEVREGIKDHLVRDPNDPNDTKWEYTYHQRLFKYSMENMKVKIKCSSCDNGSKKVYAGCGDWSYEDCKECDGKGYKEGSAYKPHLFDQIDIMCQKIADCPHTRRAQAITWKVWEDNECYDPACLQSIWARCLVDENGVWWLNMNVRMRSNDAYKAAFMNMFAFIQLQQYMANKIAKYAGATVKLGRYVHMADSYHLYGSYFKEFEGRFLKNYKERVFEDRVFNYVDVKDIMDEAVPGILEKVKNWDV